jgi:hypothetical protein
LIKAINSGISLLPKYARTDGAPGYTIPSVEREHWHVSAEPNCLPHRRDRRLYLLGEQDRIVGISGYVVRPPQARREKPRVSAFTSANIDKILALLPDLVLTFSDLQANIVADLIRRGIEVHAFNQRTVAGILDVIRMVGAMVGASGRAEELVETLEPMTTTPPFLQKSITRISERCRLGRRLEVVEPSNKMERMRKIIELAEQLKQDLKIDIGENRFSSPPLPTFNS